VVGGVRASGRAAHAFLSGESKVVSTELSSQHYSASNHCRIHVKCKGMGVLMSRAGYCQDCSLMTR
jgi:hypothetical protein